MAPDPSAPLHSAFYRFARLDDPAAVAQALRDAAHGLQGSIVVAQEGISGAVAGPAPAVQALEALISRGLTQERTQGASGGLFEKTSFKHSACVTAPFGRLKVSVKPEIVALGLPGGEGLGLPDPSDGSHLSPQAWRELLGREDVVLLDNRNHFEYRLGHFRGAVDPGVHNFRDFVAYVQQQAPRWQAEGRPVAMYCTGGVRCDKTAPWLRSLGLDVWQLDGGVLNYFAQIDRAEEDWQGECFVFDKRVALDTRLRETATTPEQVFDARHADEAWRLERARRLDGA